MLPTPSKSPWFEQGSSFISLEDIMVGVELPRQRAFMVLRFAETHSTVQVQQEFRRRFGRAPPTPVTIRNNFKKYRDEGTSQNLCKQRSGRPRTALCVSAYLRTIKARGVRHADHSSHQFFGEVTNQITNFKSPIFLFQVIKMCCMISVVIAG